ncbi:MAG: GDYXXLXY domain-containing protein [Gemmatimonadaceae bacterium]
MRSALVVAGLVLVLAIPNASIVGKERLLADGTSVLLELAPVDPRSLIQGDYMRLDYAITRQIADSQLVWPRTGQIVVVLDEHGVARFVRRHVSGTPPRAGEHLLTYRRRGRRIRVGSDAFHFQEGHAGRYQVARYGELRVSRSGTSVLVGLRDGTRQVLGRQ